MKGQRWSRPAATQLTNEQEQFLRLVAGPALRSERADHIPAAVTIAQAIIESGWGKSRLFTEAHNPFGIKNRELPDDYGEYVAMTTEYKDGVPYRELASFERFRDLDQAFACHALLFRHAKRYASAMQLANNWERFAEEIAAAGYATDPYYAEKLKCLVRRFCLNDRQYVESLAEAR